MNHRWRTSPKSCKRSISDSQGPKARPILAWGAALGSQPHTHPSAEGATYTFARPYSTNPSPPP
jgi:hypothetical protein